MLDLTYLEHIDKCLHKLDTIIETDNILPVGETAQNNDEYYALAIRFGIRIIVAQTAVRM